MYLMQRRDEERRLLMRARTPGTDISRDDGLRERSFELKTRKSNKINVKQVIQDETILNEIAQRTAFLALLLEGCVVERDHPKGFKEKLAATNGYLVQLRLKAHRHNEESQTRLTSQSMTTLPKPTMPSHGGRGSATPNLNTLPMVSNVNVKKLKVLTTSQRHSQSTASWMDRSPLTQSSSKKSRRSIRQALQTPVELGSTGQPKILCPYYPTASFLPPDWSSFDVSHAAAKKEPRLDPLSIWMK
jgi:hypothetical protein